MSALFATVVLMVAQALPPASVGDSDRRPAALRLTIGPDTTRIRGPLGPDGLPDYAAALNARYRVPPAQNAAALLVSVCGLLPKLTPGAEAALHRAMGVAEASSPLPLVGGIGEPDALEHHLRGRIARGEAVSGLERLPSEVHGQLLAEWQKASKRAWRAEEFPLLAEWVRANEAPLARLAEAVQRPRLWLPFTEGKLLVEAPALRLLGVRNSANLLRARALLRLGRSDWAGAASDLRAVDRLAVLLGGGATLIHNVMGLALRVIMIEVLPVLAAAPAPSPGDVARISAELQAMPALAHPAESFDIGERFSALSLLVQLIRRSRHGRLDPEFFGVVEEMKVFASVPPSAIEWDEAARLINRNFDDAVVVMKASMASGVRVAGEHDKKRDDAAAALTPARRDALVARAPRDAAARAELGRRLGGTFSALLTPSPLRPTIAWNETEAGRDVALMSLAAAAHRGRSGRWPASVAELVPVAWNGAPVKNGYRFAVHPGASLSGSDYAITATPDEVHTGKTSFCADASGRTLVRFAGAPARAESGRCAEPPPPRAPTGSR